MQFGKGILPAKEYLSNGLFSIQNCYSEAESSFNQQLHFHDDPPQRIRIGMDDGIGHRLADGGLDIPQLVQCGVLQLIRPSDYHRQMTDTGKHIL
mgnify:CR=1 FL=1